ncbi:MAG: 3-isopropylmalate dehydratase small subunit [Erysipelotrichales bacterium]
MNIKYNAVILDNDNIDTDIIIPKQFLKQTTKDGLGEYVFYEWRYNEDGTKNNHILNKDKFNVLITRDNFGCGSSREHASWALKDYGFKLIIAQSFSDIFYRNWLNNHQLPIKLSKSNINDILENNEIEIVLNLEDKIININGINYPFSLSNKMHKRLLYDIDEVDYTLQFIEKIKEFE